MTTIVEVYHDEASLMDLAPVVEIVSNNFDVPVVEVLVATNETQATDPQSGMPYAVMMSGGRHIYSGPTPPPPGSGQIVGDLYFPFP
jgi:hypothetical protein